jgi:hypothetical protein
VKKGYAPQTCTIPAFLPRCLVMECRDHRPPIPIPRWKCSFDVSGSVHPYTIQLVDQQMQLVIVFLFYLCVCSTCFERQAPIIRSPLAVHTASSFLCLCLSAALFCKKLAFSGASVCIDRLVQIHQTNRSIQTDAPLKASFLQNSAADRHKHRNWRLYVRLGDS